MTKTWSRSPQHMPSLDLQIWSVTSARNGFGELWNTHTGRNQGNEAQMQVEHNSSLPFSKFRYYGRLLRLLKRRRLWQGRKSKTAGWECEICTLSLGGFETSTCSPCPETFAQQHFAVSLSKRGGVGVWADSSKNALPGSPDALRPTSVHSKPDKWKQAFPPQQTTGRPWRLIIMLVNLFCSVKKPLQWVSVCCERTPNTIYGSRVYGAKTTKRLQWCKLNNPWNTAA